MRNIRGDLGLVGIENLLQMLSSAKCEGSLAVIQESQKKVIHIGPQGIRLISGARRTHPLGEILVRAGKITKDQLDELLGEQRRSGQRLGDLVAQRGIIPKDEIEYALREQVAEEIYDLFSWKGAIFNFTEGGLVPVADSPLAEITLDADVMFVILEAGRRADEMMRITTVIPDDRMIPVRMEIPTACDGPDLDRRMVEAVFPLVDGESSVAQIIGKSLYPKFTVLRTLYSLAMQGAIKVRRQEDLTRAPETVLFRTTLAEGDRPAPTGRVVAVLSGMPPFRDALAEFLRRVGYDVIDEDVVPGLEKLPAMPSVDAILLDVPIETAGGLEVCARLREKARAPFIVLANAASREALDHAIGSGARYVLLKPVRPELLLERLASVIQAPAAAPSAPAGGEGGPAVTS